MRLGIVAPADDNLYAATLLASLTAAGEKPGLVICTHRSRLSRFTSHARTYGFLAAVRRVLDRYDVSGTRAHDVRHYLAALAAGRTWPGWDRPLSRTCRALGIEYLAARSVNDPSAVDRVRRVNVDLLLSTVGEIYRPAMIETPRIGILNAHMAFLPAFRGMNVLEWSVLDGQPIGVTVHFVTEAIDAGDLVVSRNIPIEPQDTLDMLRAKSVALNVELMTEAVQLVQRDPVGSRRRSVGEGKQYFVMHPRLRRVVERQVAQQASRAH